MTAKAQTVGGTGGGISPLFILFLIFGGFWLLYKFRLWLFGLFSGERKTTQSYEILQEKGFSNAELIITGGAISPTGNYSPWWGLEKQTTNILIGVKNGILSFFCCDGPAILENAVKYEKIRHLFDIPISDIEEIAPQQKEKSFAILNIYEKSGKRTRFCFFYAPRFGLNIVLANILMNSVFKRILENGSIPKEKISQINEEILDAAKAAKNRALGNFFKGLSTVVLAGALVVGGAALAGVRTWERDR